MSMFDKLWEKIREDREEGRRAREVEREHHRQAKEQASLERQERQDTAIRETLIINEEVRPEGELLSLGVVIRDNQVWTWTTSGVSRCLGELAGAQAGISTSLKTQGAGTAVAATAAFGIIGAAGVLAARGTKPFAYIIFSDGTLYQSELKSKPIAARAQTDVLRFNALAAQVNQS